MVEVGCFQFSSLSFFIIQGLTLDVFFLRLLFSIMILHVHLLLVLILTVVFIEAIEGMSSKFLFFVLFNTLLFFVIAAQKPRRAKESKGPPCGNNATDSSGPSRSGGVFVRPWQFEPEQASVVGGSSVQGNPGDNAENPDVVFSMFRNCLLLFSGKRVKCLTERKSRQRIRKSSSWEPFNERRMMKYCCFTSLIDCCLFSWTVLLCIIMLSTTL